MRFYIRSEDKMDYDCKAETGVQLLARLSSRPNLNSLSETLFPGGINLGNIIEISGDSGSGKTTLITQFLVKCLLPKTWNEFTIGGLGAGAIIVDTDHHFQILKLVSIMESLLMKCRESNTSEVQLPKHIDSKIIEKIIKESLANLIVLNCYDSVQLFVTFHSLENILSSNANTSLIIIDSLSAYYWQDVAVRGIRKMDLYLRKMLKALQSCTEEYKVIVMYTKQTHFQSNVNFAEDSTATPGPGNVSYKIQLNRVEGKETEDLFLAEVSTPVTKCVHQYTVSDDGLMWAN
ncbi:DNA repair protein XRCC2-like [Zootermopsis nevadensis]|uniref:DNA repair protein XRCC2 n=1 Tax=Zootermopsis nevadensis TaxID=136037 RepID=A0A067R4J8_ZOONE|nr:DNA repair protein XRCC2-like [Zootermopsis nevadensis]KDR18012.1 DNA repair protein XRCC2 [Zootermopsis nevadensis]